MGRTLGKALCSQTRCAYSSISRLFRRRFNASALSSVKPIKMEERPQRFGSSLSGLTRADRTRSGLGSAIRFRSSNLRSSSTPRSTSGPGGPSDTRPTIASTDFEGSLENQRSADIRACTGRPQARSSAVPCCAARRASQRAKRVGVRGLACNLGLQHRRQVVRARRTHPSRYDMDGLVQPAPQQEICGVGVPAPSLSADSRLI